MELIVQENGRCKANCRRKWQRKTRENAQFHLQKECQPYSVKKCQPYSITVPTVFDNRIRWRSFVPWLWKLHIRNFGEKTVFFCLFLLCFLPCFPVVRDLLINLCCRAATPHRDPLVSHRAKYWTRPAAATNTVAATPTRSTTINTRNSTHSWFATLGWCVAMGRKGVGSRTWEWAISNFKIDRQSGKASAGHPNPNRHRC